MFTVLIIIVYTFLSSLSSAEGTGVETKYHRIVGGEDAIQNEFPWLVRLTIDSNILCAGAIINETFILTAAHCFKGEENSSIHVVAGDHNQLIEESTEQRRTGVNLVVHSRYDKSTFDNDIALVELNSALSFTEAVAAIQLPSTTFDPEGTVTVAGWGDISEGSSITQPILQKVNLTIVPVASCAKAYEGGISIKMICTVGEGKDSCQGDSGGPVLCSENNVTVVCGIISFGNGCARDLFPGVNTRVSSYRDWIAGSNVVCYNSGLLPVIFILSYFISKIQAVLLN